MYVCPYCGKQFHTAQGLRVHAGIKHKRPVSAERYSYNASKLKKYANGYYYCSKCQIWVKADDPKQVYYDRQGQPHHRYCGNRLRTRPKWIRQKDKPDFPRVTVTPVTTNRYSILYYENQTRGKCPSTRAFRPSHKIKEAEIICGGR